jgi:hypothetical protein
MGKLQLLPTEFLTGGRCKYNRFLPGASRGSLAALLLQTLCHTARRHYALHLGWAVGLVRLL